MAFIEDNSLTLSNWVWGSLWRFILTSYTESAKIRSHRIDWGTWSRLIGKSLLKNSMLLIQVGFQFKKKRVKVDIFNILTFLSNNFSVPAFAVRLDKFCSTGVVLMITKNRTRSGLFKVSYNCWSQDRCIWTISRDFNDIT